MADKSWQARGFRDDGTVTSYIVRVYRRRNEPEVTGMVEFPELGKSQPFHSFEELRAILGHTRIGKVNRAKARTLQGPRRMIEP
jgi:hypothetical protein